MQKYKQEMIVVGGGLAGLAAAMKLAEKGHFVQLVSIGPARRAHSVCAQGGINAAINEKGEGDSPLIHAYDTIKGGDFLADQPPVLEMCLAAPAIIHLMDRLGCTFNRSNEGHLDFRRFGGTLYHRTAFCGASTGQQLLYSLDEQVRRYEAKGLIKRFEHHEFMRLILDSHAISRGIVVMDTHTMRMQVLKADAVLIATGGLGGIFKRSTNSTTCTGAANGRLFMQGMHYANAEFIQIHPSAIPGLDKLRLISESVRGEGGRVWVWGDSSKTIQGPDGKQHVCGKSNQPWYFLEELYPAYGNLVPRDVGAREILRVCEAGLGIDGDFQVHLDVTHLGNDTWKKLESVLDIYEKFTGKDPKKEPMKIFPAVHYSMGGAWVDWPTADDQDRYQRYRQMSNLRGCFNAGESEFQYHGANRLGANSLLACIFAGLVAGNEMSRYVQELSSTCQESPSKVFDSALKLEEGFQKELIQREGPENIYQLHDELADVMLKNVSVKRNNKDLSDTLQIVHSIKERYLKISLSDRSKRANQTLAFASQFKAMLELSLAITKAALLRDEFRGAHFKPEFPQRDDKNWLKTSICVFHPKEPQISYRTVDTRHLEPIKRDYVSAKKTKIELKNIPQNIEPIL